jgi:hypothetical protein
MTRILAFAGSARRDSLNKKLARVAAQYARKAGGEVTLVDLDDYPMPVYHGDLEDREGMPENARKLRERWGLPDCPCFRTIAGIGKFHWRARRSSCKIHVGR